LGQSVLEVRVKDDLNKSAEDRVFAIISCR